MKYFAYGEKMFSPNLLKDIPHAQTVGVAKLIGYKLFFHNRGQDDFSGKCNILPVKDPSQEVFGVLYDITQEEQYILDKEVLGTNQVINLQVHPLHSSTTAPEFAFTYVAHKENVFEDLVPFHWYKEMVILGAREHQLPDDYIHMLEQMASTHDPNPQRAMKQKRYLDELCEI